MSIIIAGGGFVTAKGWGRRGELPELSPSAGKTSPLPGPKKLFPKIPKRWGRFDTFTRMGCTAAALAISDARTSGENRDLCGMVVSTRYDTVNTDRAYYRTTLEANGAFGSPNLFSYTLPVIVLGECAVAFDLRGPTLCLGDQPGEQGLEAVKTAIRLMESGKAQQKLAGVVEDPPVKTGKKPEAIFLVLQNQMIEESGTPDQPEYSTLTLEDGKLKSGTDRMIRSISDLFQLDIHSP
jgi:3-oxoacyl-(acyl-carrier-protein) synthase